MEPGPGRQLCAPSQVSCLINWKESTEPTERQRTTAVTTPSRINEILHEMEQDPELVNTAFDAVVSAMSQAGENTARALEEQGRRIEGVESALAELREEGQRTRESLGQVLTDVKQLQADTTETKADVKQLQADMAEARGDIKHLQTTSDELRSDVRNIQGDVRRIDGRLDRGFGTNYEAKVSQNVRSILGQQAGVRNAGS